MKLWQKRSDHQRRSDCLRTAKFINCVKNTIDKDPGKSMPRDENV